MLWSANCHIHITILYRCQELSSGRSAKSGNETKRSFALGTMQLTLIIRCSFFETTVHSIFLHYIAVEFYHVVYHIKHFASVYLIMPFMKQKYININLQVTCEALIFEIENQETTNTDFNFQIQPPKGKTAILFSN